MTAKGGSPARNGSTALTISVTVPICSKPDPDGEHRKDQGQQAAFDEGKRLVRVDASGQQDDRDADDRQSQDWGDTKRRKHDDAQQHADGNRGLTAPVGLDRGMRDIDQFHVGGQTLDILGRAFQKQCVANAHDQIVQLPADVLVPPMHRQRIDAVAPPQAHRTKRPADHLCNPA